MKTIGVGAGNGYWCKISPGSRQGNDENGETLCQYTVNIWLTFALSAGSIFSGEDRREEEGVAVEDRLRFHLKRSISESDSSASDEKRYRTGEVLVFSWWLMWKNARVCNNGCVCVLTKIRQCVCVYTHVLTRRRQNNADVGDLKKKWVGNRDVFVRNKSVWLINTCAEDRTMERQKKWRNWLEKDSYWKQRGGNIWNPCLIFFHWICFCSSLLLIISHQLPLTFFQNFLFLHKTSFHAIGRGSSWEE